VKHESMLLQERSLPDGDSDSLVPYSICRGNAGGGGQSVTEFGNFQCRCNNSWVTNEIAASVGVRVNGYNASPWDAVPNVIGLNGNPFALIGSIVAAPLLWTGSSPHTAPRSDWIRD
jgi:hypothetical protein